MDSVEGVAVKEDDLCTGEPLVRPLMCELNFKLGIEPEVFTSA
jgi:hypothetical protein